MQVRKLVIGAAIAAVAVLSACSSQQPQSIGLAAGQQNATSASATTTTTSSPTATATATPTATSSTKTQTPTSSKTTPKTTTDKPAPPKTTTDKPAAPPSDAPCSAAAKACIRLSTNESWLMDNGQVVYGPVKITSGRPGHLTRVGTFHVQYKDKDHKSKEFNMAPMPYSVFFDNGIAFHQGSLSVKSHGCIHLSMAAAQKYFASLSVGDVVQVVP
jgi:lipoprotein-anchoring transpeptidase ErfK/SrfK